MTQIPQGLTARFELVSPEKATKWMEKNKHNRPFKEYLLTKYSADLENQTFGVTHQGIAFDIIGALVDGQHRLAAIIHTRTPAVLLVTRGLPVEVQGHRHLLTRDLVDIGKNRTIADHLSLNHGVTDAVIVASACNTIFQTLLGDLYTGGTRASVASSLAVLSLYGDEIRQMISAVNAKKHIRKASMIGALALCAKSNYEHIDRFVEQLSSGEGVRRGMPVYALRERLILKGVGGARKERAESIEMVCNAYRHTVQGDTVSNVRSGNAGLEWIRAAQRKNIDKLTATIAGKNGSNGAK